MTSNEVSTAVPAIDFLGRMRERHEYYPFLDEPEVPELDQLLRDAVARGPEPEIVRRARVLLVRLQDRDERFEFLDFKDRNVHTERNTLARLIDDQATESAASAAPITLVPVKPVKFNDNEGIAGICIAIVAVMTAVSTYTHPATEASTPAVAIWGGLIGLAAIVLSRITVNRRGVPVSYAETLGVSATWASASALVQLAPFYLFAGDNAGMLAFIGYLAALFFTVRVVLK
jgi:hypothetical protein